MRNTDGSRDRHNSKKIICAEKQPLHGVASFKPISLLPVMRLKPIIEEKDLIPGRLIKVHRITLVN